MKPQTIKAYATLMTFGQKQQYLISPRTMLPAVHKTRPMQTGYSFDVSADVVPVTVTITMGHTRKAKQPRGEQK